MGLGEAVARVSRILRRLYQAPLRVEPDLQLPYDVAVDTATLEPRVYILAGWREGDVIQVPVPWIASASPGEAAAVVAALAGTHGEYSYDEVRMIAEPPDWRLEPLEELPEPPAELVEAAARLVEEAGRLLQRLRVQPPAAWSREEMDRLARYGLAKLTQIHNPLYEL